MMKLLYRIALVVPVLALTACQTVSPMNGPMTGPVEPTRMEYLNTDHVYVILDGSDTMYAPEKFPLAKATLISMIGAAPRGNYNAAFTEFGGHPRDWVEYPFAPFDRDGMRATTEMVEWLGGTTPLDVALDSIKDDLMTQQGRGVVIILSDGVTDKDASVAAARGLADAYDGDLCVYGIHVGKSRLGLETLSDITHATGCGRTWRANHVQTDAEMAAMIREIFFSRKPDADLDNVPDDEDKCPGTPLGAPVNYDGCWIIEPVLFDVDKSDIRPIHNETLDDVAEIMTRRGNGGKQLWVDGHTDSTHNSAYNQSLSERRSNAVKGALVSRGMSGSQLKTRAHGEGKPAQSNRTSEGRQQNRRVELKVVR